MIEYLINFLVKTLVPSVTYLLYFLVKTLVSSVTYLLKFFLFEFLIPICGFFLVSYLLAIVVTPSRMRFLINPPIPKSVIFY